MNIQLTPTDLREYAEDVANWLLVDVSHGEVHEALEASGVQLTDAEVDQVIELLASDVNVVI